MRSISNRVKSIQDIMRKDVGTYGAAQRIADTFIEWKGKEKLSRRAAA